MKNPVWLKHAARRIASAVIAALFAFSLLPTPGMATSVRAEGARELRAQLVPAAPDAFTFPFTESFKNAATTDPNWVLGGTAYLTSGNGDTAGDGWLRLTKNTTYQAGYAYYNMPIQTSRGLVITFDYAAWGGAAADGLTFFLFDGATTTFNVGASGGSLGYANKTGVNGLSNGYLGLALDEFGNYSNPNEGRSGGPGAIPESVAIRGPGSGTTGYAYLAGTKNITTLSPALPKLDCPKNFTGTTGIGITGSCGAGTTRPADTIYSRQVRITVTPVGSAYSVSVDMKFNKGATSWTTLFGPFTMTTSAPGTLKMGFAGSTGGQVNYHEIRNLNVTQQVPDLTATKAVQNATTGGGSVAPGDQLLYTVVLNNQTNTAITGVVFTDTIPANTTYVANSASVPSGSVLGATSPTLNVTDITVPANGQATITFKVQVNNSLPAGVSQISNQGWDIYNSITSQTDGDSVTDGNQATVISVTAGPNFDTSTKSVTYNDANNDGAVSPGETLTYHVVLPNTGNQNSPTTSFTDTLPSNTTYVTGTATASGGTVSYNSTTKTLSWTASVNAGSQATLDFKVTVNSGVKIRDVISNQGTITYGTTSVLTDADLATPGKQPTQLLVGGVATLTATKTASVVSSPLQPGGEVLYTIVLTNTGSYTVTGATFADTLPANTTYVASSAATTSGTASYTAPSVNVTGISLPTKGSSATITFRVTVNNPLPAGVTQISNQGVASWDSNQSGANNTSLQTDGDSATVGQQPTINAISNADLTVTKTVDNSAPAEAGTIVYTVHVTNTGPAAVSTAAVTDPLPAGLTYGSSSATLGSYSSPTWSVGALASGASARLTITATVNLGQGGSTITNTASVSSELYDANSANNMASAGLTVKTTALTGVVTDKDTGAKLANVSVQVTTTDSQGSHICTATTDANGVYTVTSGVGGCLLAPGTATVAATAAPAGYLLTSASKTITAGVTNVQDLALVRPSLSGVVTDLGTGVPLVGATVTLTQNSTTCTTTTGAGGAYSFVAGTACNFTAGAATVTASQTRYQDASASPTILSAGPTTQDLALGTTDLLITKTDSQTVAEPGDTLSYVLTVVNNGSITADAVTLKDVLPAYLTYVSDDSGVTPVESPAGTWTWSLGSLAKDASKTFTVQAKLASSLPDGTTALSNYAKVTTTSAEKDTTNNEVSDVDTVTTHPDLTIAKTFTSASPAGTGSTVTYQLSGGNSGHATATGVTITDTLDALTTYNTGTASLTVNGGSATVTVSYNSGTRELTLGLPDLAPDATYVLTFNATVGTITGASLFNTAVIDATQADLDTGNDTASLYVPTRTAADVTVLKSAGTSSPTPMPGDLITYTLAYRNDGLDPAANVQITDAVPANTTLVAGTYTGTVGSGIITWSLDALASRATGTVSFTVQITNALPAGVSAIANTAAITTTTTDASPLNNTSTTSTPVTAQPDLVISKTDSQKQVLAGDTIRYTITYSNTGNQAAAGVVITDTLFNGVEIDAAQLTGNTYNGSTPASTYDVGAGTLIWNIGALPVDGAHSITLYLKVKSGALPSSVAADRVTIADDTANGADPNPANGTATDSDLVTAPYIVLEKQAAGPAYPGQPVTYTIQWSNTGDVTASSAIVTDTLPANTTLVAGSITGGGTESGGVITWNLGDKTASASGTVSFAVTPGVTAGGSTQPTATLSTETGRDSVTITSTTTAVTRPWCDFDKCAAFKDIYQGADGTPPPGYDDNPRMTAFDDSGWTQPAASSTTEYSYWTNPADLSAEWVAPNTDGHLDGNFSFFRQAFCLPLNATGLSANLELAGDDVSDIYLNGVYLGQEVGAGGADSFTATPGIQSGINILAVQLLNNRHGGHAALGGQDHIGLLFNLGAAYTSLRPFASAPNTVREDTDVVFSANELAIGGRTPYSYTITYGDGSPAADYQLSNTFTHQYTTPGVYTATLTARAQYGCTGSDQIVVTVLPSGSTLLANSAAVTYADANGKTLSGQSGAGLELLPAADLSIVKSVVSGGTTPGDGVTYQLLVTNNGPNAVTGAVVSDTVPAAVTGVTWTCVSSGGTCTNTSGSSNPLYETVSLPSGATATYTIQGTIAPAATGTLTNTATVAPPAGITDLAQANNSSSVSRSLTPQVTLGVNKTSSPNPGLAPGRGDIYTIVVSNTGKSDAASVSVQDTFPAAITDVTWTCAASSGSTCTADGSGNIANTATILAGGSVTYTVRGTVDSGAIVGTVIANTATATYETTPASSATDNNTLVAMTSLTATKDALSSSDVSSRIVPFIDADSSGGVSPGDTLKYQVVITNGANTAYNVLYNDTPDPNTTLVAGSVTCAPACSNTSSSTAVSVTFASMAGSGSATITYRVTVNNPLPFQLATLANQGHAASANAYSLATDDPATGETGDPTVMTLTMGSISGVTWEDDNDGVKETGEPVLANTPVTLYYAGANGVWGDGDDQTAYSISDANGAYSFGNLAAGKYQVGFYQRLGFTFSSVIADNKADSTGLTAELTLATNQQMTGVSAGEVSQLDFGNLPTVYADTTLAQDGARHVITGTLHLGPTILIENDGAVGTPADNDGIVPPSQGAWTAGASRTLTVTASGSGYLWAWFDWNDDGDFSDAGEAVDLGTVISAAQTVTLSIPSNYVADRQLYSRFRLYPEGYAQEFVPYGVVFGGEVEDYEFKFSPTAGELESFTADATAAGVTLAWETISELGVLGFNLYRCAPPDGPWVRLNPRVIPSVSPGSSDGHRYTWLDQSAHRGVVYTYRLEVMNLSGTPSLAAETTATYLSLWLPVIVTP
ncbi:MAG: carboxypeptidase regulatory-like domain-containing protein [Chloroflexi bacterium]|nr:carboxypeptidase regulatory-like domain-containing protein [Chloroflexota bacterium]